MAVSFYSTPTTSFLGPRPAGQKLIYTLRETTATPDRYVVFVFEGDTYGAPGTNDGTQIAKLYLTPNSTGYAHFDLSDIAEGRVSAPNYTNTGFPVHTATGTALKYAESDGIRKYTIKAAQYNSGTESAVEATSQIFLIGGAHQLSEGLNPSFSTYYPTVSTNQAWLSNRPFTFASDTRTEMYMADDDEATAQIMITTFLGVSTLLNRIEYKLYDDTGALVSTVYITTAYSLTIYENMLLIPLGPENVDGVFGGSWVSDWAYYDIRPVGSGASPIVYGKTIRVYRDCRPYKHDPVQLAWKNTVGGWDYLRFDGRNLKTITTETKSYRKTLGTYDATTFTYRKWDRETTPYQVTGKETYNLRNRSFDAVERDLLQYAFRSKDVMFRVGSGAWLPCTIQTNTYTVQPAASQLFDVSFNIELSQEIRC